jgi:hypothetical protein
MQLLNIVVNYLFLIDSIGAGRSQTQNYRFWIASQFEKPCEFAIWMFFHYVVNFIKNYKSEIFEICGWCRSRHLKSKCFWCRNEYVIVLISKVNTDHFVLLYSLSFSISLSHLPKVGQLNSPWYWATRRRGEFDDTELACCDTSI